MVVCSRDRAEVGRSVGSVVEERMERWIVRLGRQERGWVRGLRVVGERVGVSMRSMLGSSIPLDSDPVMVGCVEEDLNLEAEVGCDCAWRSE